jgi:iron complex outermembrane receptor protein
MCFVTVWRRAVLGALAVACFLAPPLAAQTGEIVGRVVEGDSLPVTDAAVILEGAGRVTRTTGDGRFAFTAVRPGAWTLRVERIGYRTRSVAVTVGTAAPRDVTIRLERVAVDLGTVTVIGTRADLDETRDRMTLVPGSVRLVESAELRATRQANLTDVLRFTPGVWVQPRFGAADESQLSIRGSGLRNNFHLRGVNVLVNGMPYRNADGFTDFESLELLTTQAIEVYKGANALRYGGSTLGGALNLITETGHTAAGPRLFAQGGSFGFYKAQVAGGGAPGDGAFDWYASFGRTGLDGYRAWSDQERDRVNLHAGRVLSPGVDVRSFYFFARVREHLPGALTPAQFAADPRQADSVNVADRWGRDYDLHHVGLQLRARLAANQRVEIAPYFQYRDINHPIFQTIAQVSRDGGIEARYENTAPLGSRTNRLTVGVQWAAGNLDHRRYVNDPAAPRQRGALTKDQRDDAASAAAYVEDVVALTARLSAVLGARVDHAVREVRDHFVADGDQSERRTYTALMPRMGLLWETGGSAQLYANASRSYEPPLLLELNSFSQSGFAAVRPQDSWQFEIGTRGRAGRLDWDVTLYDAEIADEIMNINVQPFPNAPFTVPGYRNAARTRHFGLEAGVGWRPTEAIETRIAYTAARYQYVRDSAYGGNDIPGAPRHVVQGELTWRHPSGLSLTPSVEWVPQAYYVSSDNRAQNAGWTSVGLRAEWTPRDISLTVFAAVHNLTDARHAATVQVDNAAGKFLEPADRRSTYAGLRWQP